MAYFAPDCVFHPAGGDQILGGALDGTDAIAQAFVGVWTAMPDAKWADHTHEVIGDRALSEWTFSGTTADGMRTEARGVDIFTIKGGKIARKNAFRKQRPPFKAS